MINNQLILLVSILLILSVGLFSVQNVAAEKGVTVTQKCENAVLELSITNQDEEPISNAKVFDNTRMKVLASSNENGILNLSSDLQNKQLRAGGGSYPLISFTAKDCQPKEILFEKNENDVIIIHHNSFSHFDPAEDNSDAPHLTPFTGTLIGGDIINMSEYNLTDIKIAIQPFDEILGSGESKSWYPIKKVLRPGETSPFFSYMSGGYNNYKIKIDDYKATTMNPIDPSVKIFNVLIDQDKHGNESLTIFCKNTLDDAETLHLIFLGYSKGNLLDRAFVGEHSLWAEKDLDKSNCLTDGKVDASEFLEYAKDDRFEVFIVSSGQNLFYDVQEITKIESSSNAYQQTPDYIIQKPIHSNYYPDSLSPKYINLEQLKSNIAVQDKSNKSESKDIQNKNFDELSNTIPVWIKINAEWWAQNKIDDTTFISGIQFLIKNGILDVSPITEDVQEKSNEIPSWIKGNAEFWAQGLISDDDFLNGAQYLVQQGIIKV